MLNNFDDDAVKAFILNEAKELIWNEVSTWMMGDQ